MNLETRLSEVKGVGDVIGKKFAAVRINSIAELVDYYPRRYEDYSKIQSIADIRPGVVSLKVVIKQAKGRYVRRGMHITEAIASDKTGSVRLIWFNQPYRASSIKYSEKYFISGQFELSRQRLSIINPSMELVSNFPLNTARIVPIYSQIGGIKSTEIRKLLREVSALINNLGETLPTWLIQSHKLLSRSKAVFGIHFPDDDKVLTAAKRRLGFEEVFNLSLASLLNKYEIMQEHSLRIPFKLALAKKFVTNLAFDLTDDQRRVVWQIYKDLEKTQPMNRLVEGDVGSGKTVVAVMSALMAMEQGFQVAYMAPTELLARQHAQTIYDLLEPLGFATQVGLLVGSLKPSQKRSAQTRIKTGEIRLIVGTHALISEKVGMLKLGLVIIDEQHRFGVEQRKQLLAKAGHAPHILTMTATPIPRSLALTLYGELDISILQSKPLGRKKIITKIISPNSTTQLYTKVKEELSKGRQMFVVCPQILESDIGGKSAEAIYKLIRSEFKEYKVGLLHGKLKADEKNKVMSRFLDGKTDILVSTTVIEVGVDVPNATVILIEDAERFGLAQIHQLRGRVGRSEHQGYCYLIKADSSAPSRRLRALEGTDNGFELAELDLNIRGPGAIYGSMQHGQLDLRIAKLDDSKLIAEARQSAQEFINRGENLLKYKELNMRVQTLRAVTNLN